MGSGDAETEGHLGCTQRAGVEAGGPRAPGALQNRWAALGNAGTGLVRMQSPAEELRFLS